MSELEARITSILPRVWRLARAGFLLSGPPVERVLGVASTDQAERLTAEIVAATLRTPEGRALDLDAWRRAVDAETRRRLEAHALTSGGAITLDGPPPEGLVLLDGPTVAEPLDPPLDLDARARADVIAEVARAQLLALGEDDRALVTARAKPGATRASVAAQLGIAAPRITAREATIRRHVRHALAARGVRAGAAEIDAALAGDATALTLAQPTIERMLHGVMTRFDPSPVRSSAARWTWGLATLGVGAALGALIYAGILPGPDDDHRVEPAVGLSCSGPCRPGSEADVRVAAPRGMRRVAVQLVDAAGRATWVADTMGRSIALPYAARNGSAGLGRTVVVPEGRELKLLAVYSKDRLTRATLARIARGGAPEPDALAVWSTVPLE